jgi:hypothetical protein
MELHIGTIGIHHGRKKKKVKQSSLKLAKHNSEIEGTYDQGTLEIEQNESNTRALGFQKCGAQLCCLRFYSMLSG